MMSRRDKQVKQVKWIDKVYEAFVEELAGINVPEHPDEKKLQDKILTLVQYRISGLDHRKVGKLAADFYRLMYKTRERIIEDLAQVAAANEGGAS
jgi:hypothetical protein